MSLEEIMTVVHIQACKNFKVDFEKTFTTTRKQEIVDARHVTMCLIRHLFNEKYSYQNIANYFNQTHCNAIAAEKATNNNMFRNRIFAKKYENIYNESINILGISKKKREFEDISLNELLSDLRKMYHNTKDRYSYIKFNKILNELSSRL